MNPHPVQPHVDGLGLAELRLELGRTELALERAATSSNAPAADAVIAALQKERDRLRERLRQVLRP